ncbi:hypothetical protein Micbo1qcDRAFT_174631 [Microdochium bolleyi]|uniref:Uncharacterized protein n=1 Tax=Microdochium bolleyi TaxID=196109 RepID=A0A136J8U2_9PEZI|nr:hypothetical protein Micbo1qcDRAFT_174631 [Microdochium bolleyi]
MYVDEDLEMFFKPAEPGEADDTWHELASRPLTEPKVSSIVTSSQDLDELETRWMGTHREMCSLAHCREAGEWVRYGDLGDDHRGVEPTTFERGRRADGDPDIRCLLQCCGEDQPVNKSQTLTVTPSTANGSVTVKDYISAVHPWLISMHDNIMKSKEVEPEVAEPDAATLDWMVIPGPTNEIRLRQDFVKDRAVMKKRIASWARRERLQQEKESAAGSAPS